MLERIAGIIGGAEGDRTPDLMTASHALSQLSYGPKWRKLNYHVAPFIGRVGTLP